MFLVNVCVCVFMHIYAKILKKSTLRRFQTDSCIFELNLYFLSDILFLIFLFIQFKGNLQDILNWRLAIIRENQPLNWFYFSSCNWVNYYGFKLKKKR